MQLSNREADVLTACLQYLHMRGIFCWRNNNAGVYDPVRKRYRGFRGLKGVSDILGILPRACAADGAAARPGLFLAVEVKRPGGKTQPAQQWFLDQVAEQGGIALCVRSVDELAEELDRALGNDQATRL